MSVPHYGESFETEKLFSLAIIFSLTSSLTNHLTLPISLRYTLVKYSNCDCGHENHEIITWRIPGDTSNESKQHIEE